MKTHFPTHDRERRKRERERVREERQRRGSRGRSWGRVERISRRGQHDTLITMVSNRTSGIALTLAISRRESSERARGRERERERESEAGPPVCTQLHPTKLTECVPGEPTSTSHQERREENVYSVGGCVRATVEEGVPQRRGEARIGRSRK